jgi:hypothetical protein
LKSFYSSGKKCHASVELEGSLFSSQESTIAPS